jgi:hypothetical protein
MDDDARIWEHAVVIDEVVERILRVGCSAKAVAFRVRIVDRLAASLPFFNTKRSTIKTKQRFGKFFEGIQSLFEASFVRSNANTESTVQVHTMQMLLRFCGISFCLCFFTERARRARASKVRSAGV